MSAVLDRDTADLFKLWHALRLTPTCIQRRREFYYQNRFGGPQTILALCKRHAPLFIALKRAEFSGGCADLKQKIAKANISTCPHCLLEKALLTDEPSCLLESRPFSFAALMLMR